MINKNPDNQNLLDATDQSCCGQTVTFVPFRNSSESSEELTTENHNTLDLSDVQNTNNPDNLTSNIQCMDTENSAEDTEKRQMDTTQSNGTKKNAQNSDKKISDYSPAEAMEEISENESDYPNSIFNSSNNNSPKIPSNQLSYHCKDPIFGELICDFCHYTNFGKRAMLNHLKKKHDWKSDQTMIIDKNTEIIEGPTIEIPAAISPIHEKHVSFAEKDTIINDFSKPTAISPNREKHVSFAEEDTIITDYSKPDDFEWANERKSVGNGTKKKPFIYDGTDIINKIFATTEP